jgi:hypothetical protein
VSSPSKRAWPSGDGTASSVVADGQETADGAGWLRVFWSWNAGKGWVAADNARLDFSHSSMLYKLYLVHDRPEEERSAPTTRVSF